MGVRGQGIRGCQRGWGSWGGSPNPRGAKRRACKGGRAALIGPILKGEGRTLKNCLQQALACQQMMLIHWGMKVNYLEAGWLI